MTERPHVLIVSADADLTDFLAQGLLFAGFWASAVASALQTLEVFRLRSFDLVLVDAALPGLGALELVRRLRGRSPRAGPGQRAEAPILVIEEASEAFAAAAAAAGADGLLSPPLDLDELAPRLRAAITSWQERPPSAQPFVPPPSNLEGEIGSERRLPP